MMDTVALVKYEEDVERTLEEGLKIIGGFEGLSSPVIIKPNICTISDNTGFSVTDVRVIEALIKLVLKQDGNLSIRIAESDSQSKFADEAFEKFGYKQLVDEMRRSDFDVALLNLSRSKVETVPFNGIYFHNPEFPSEITEPHYFISVAVAKTHYLTFITGVLKNQFGLLPRKQQSYYHSQITGVIVDLNRFIQPDLCIVDARVGLEGWNGPKSRRLDAFILGYKPVSVDATMAQIMGFEPEKIRHLVEANKYNLGTLNPIVQGQSLESLRVHFEPPRT